MAKVEVTIEEVTLKNDSGRALPGVRAECVRCGYVVESFGTGDGSRRRCLAVMRDDCPELEVNYYEEG
jgi:hypothetical protein